MTALSLLKEVNQTPTVLQSNRSLSGKKTLAPHVQDAINHSRNAQLLELQKMTAAAKKVFNPLTHHVTVFKDCSNGRTYTQIGKRLEYFTPETLESMVEPRPAPPIEALKI